MGEAGDRQITGLALDSREVVAGNVFIALAGAKQHGLAHVAQAVDKGACVVVFDPAGGRKHPVEQINNVPMIGMGIVPQPGSNYLDIADEVYKRFDIIKKELPKEYKVEMFLDNTIFVKRSVEEVGETLLIAIGLVVLIIFIFFRI